MFMIDGVEDHIVDHVDDIGDFENEDAIGREKAADAGENVVGAVLKLFASCDEIR